MQVICKVHDHGHAFFLETKDNFWMRTDIDRMETTWAEKNTSYYDHNLYSDSCATKYSRFKKHCITKTCHMYSRGDKGETKHSANMVSDQVAAQMAAMEQQGEQRNNDIEKNQCKLADAMNQMVSDVSIGCEGGMPPIIETKSLGTAATVCGTDLSSLR
mmetsp:Transcript_21572/g.23951  ORF Transcript_21572/g.23951 Transcript_21572/m.23951 type:complete len:159 (-) Transcript_21572:249-725(-)